MDPMTIASLILPMLLVAAAVTIVVLAVYWVIRRAVRDGIRDAQAPVGGLATGVEEAL